MNENLSIVGVENTSISVMPAAAARRDELLIKAARISSVQTLEQATEAGDTLKDLKNFSRVIEASRKDVKAPVLELIAKIDGTARDLSLEIDAKVEEIGAALAAWQTEQNRIAEQRRREAFEETERLRKEAQRKEREEEARIASEAKAEADRLAKIKADNDAREKKAQADKEAAAALAAAALAAKAKADKEAAEATNKKGREAAAAAQKQAEDAAAQAKTAKEAAEVAEKAAKDKSEADQMLADAEAHDRQQRLDAEARDREATFVASSVEIQQSAARIAPAKQAGISTRSDLKFEITDIIALYEAQAAFVILSPNNAAIKAALNGNPNLILPGVKHWREAKSVVR